MRIIDLQPEDREFLHQAATLLAEGFREVAPHSWPTLGVAMEEVQKSLGKGRISRVAVDEAGTVLGWIGGAP